MRSSLRIILSFLPAVLMATEPSFTSRDMKAPVYDASGQLIRRLHAATASGPTSAPKLEQGRVEFFDPKSGEQPIGLLTFDRTRYDRPTERISDDGAITFASLARQETISGRGYVCELEAGRLTLRADVRFSSPRFDLTGDQADVRFDPRARANDAAIREVVLTGKVTLDRAASPGVAAERIETTHARYDAAEQKIYLRSPITSWRNGQKIVSEFGTGYFEINLAPVPPPPGAPAK